MMEIESLRKHCFENKPASLRCARQKTATPEEVIRMNYNENPYGMSARARELLLAAASEASQYQDLNSVELRQAIGDLYGLGEDNVLVGSGSSAVIDMIGEIFLNEGEEVVCGAPSYEAFPDMARDNGGVRVPVPLTGDYRFDLAAMREAVNERTKLVIVVNPNNPTGTIRSGKELAAFIRSLPPPSSQPSTRPTRST